jgi:hypothetical protein
VNAISIGLKELPTSASKRIADFSKNAADFVLGQALTIIILSSTGQFMI